MDRDELLRLLKAFESEGLEYVLIGATAMGLHGVIRSTEDVDLFVRASRLKKDTVRPLDRQGAAALAERFDLKEND